MRGDLRLAAWLVVAMNLAWAWLAGPRPLLAQQTSAAGTHDRVARDVPLESSVSFDRQVMSMVNRLGCNQITCHGTGRGKGGLSLSLFGGEPRRDYEALTREAQGRRIDRVEPEQSLILRKLTGALEHGGSRLIEPGSRDQATLVSWIAQGARWDDPRMPELIALELTPVEQALQAGQSAKLRAEAVYADGSRLDVTADASFRSLDSKVASIESPGEVKAAGLGQASLVATYLRQPATARVLVPQTLAEPYPEVEPFNRVDELVFARLRMLGIPPSALCDDATFLRRAYLDVTGLMATETQAREFLADTTPDKRARLVDRLLSSEEYNDFQTLKWGDLLKIKSEYPSRLWPKAVAVYTHWIRDSIATNKPYDQFVRELLTANGSNFRVGPANYLRAVSNKDPQTIAESTALVFLGQRISCARCHAHPDEPWTTSTNLGLGAFFAKVAYKPSNEWKEEIVYTNPKGVLKDPVSRQAVAPAALDGTSPAVDAIDDPRSALAAWVTSNENPHFARNIVNRVWFWLMGRGIVQPPDDLRLTNPPSNPELLDFLAAELVDHSYDLRHIFRLILLSRTYQLDSRPTEQNAWDTTLFSHRLPRRLGAEQLLDAITQITGVPDRFSSRIPEPFTYLPDDIRATQLTDGNIEEAPFAFLELFGRPSRDTAYEDDRCLEPSLRQALYFANSEHLEGKITASPFLKEVLESGRNDAEIVEQLYLIMFSRFPSDEELRATTAHLAREGPKGRTQALRDLVWALTNTKEFRFIR